MCRNIAFFVIICLVLPFSTLEYGDYNMHPHFSFNKIRKRSISEKSEENENVQKFWVEKGQEALKSRVRRKLNENVAKNVIMFLGDGMSIPTISATRVYLGGEEKDLAFDTFPFTGLSKTYCIDKQVADSACSATAYLGGVKGNYGTIGVTGSVKRGNCPKMLNVTNHVYSIAYHFQQQHRKTGLVTTARVTHASPAGMYAHVADRDWENDRDVMHANYNPILCTDIAKQLVFGETGRELNVVLGGGRSNFRPSYLNDEQGIGSRSENNLIDDWLHQKKDLGYSGKYVWNRDQLMELNYNSTDFLLGLFNDDHMSFNLKRNKSIEPSLEEMTIAAIKILQKSRNGFFLFVEGARIDMGHHNAQAKIALDETAEFSKAVQAAIDLSKEEDTLIIVTSDHAHTLSYSGYADRGNDILGIAGNADDTLPYTTLNYANGPGYREDKDHHRFDFSHEKLYDDEFRYPGIAPMTQETHGGDDVAIFAQGPWAHLFTGVMEENVLPHLMSYASCVGKGATVCDKKKWDLDNSLHLKSNAKKQ